MWGGDWLHALSEPEYVGRIGGRMHLLEVSRRLSLQVPAALLPHRLPALLSIDHVALPARLPVRSAYRVVAAVDDRRLSDHDAYVVQVDLASQ